MAVVATVQAQVDTALTTLWGLVQTRQANYLAAHGGYWTGLRTHTVTPADGVTALPTIGSTVPYFQTAADAWPAAVLSTAIPMAVAIDQYNGPQGIGYQGTVWVLVNGTLYSRCQQFGPEVYRNRGWAVDGTTP